MKYNHEIDIPEDGDCSKCKACIEGYYNPGYYPEDGGPEPLCSIWNIFVEDEVQGNCLQCKDLLEGVNNMKNKFKAEDIVLCHHVDVDTRQVVISPVVIIHKKVISTIGVSGDITTTTYECMDAYGNVEVLDENSVLDISHESKKEIMYKAKDLWDEVDKINEQLEKYKAKLKIERSEKNQH